MATFQIKLGGAWSNYEKVEDKILKRAFMAGFPNAKFELRGQRYQYDFSKMLQRNLETGKEREIRAPHKWLAPTKPIVPAGPTMAVNVPKGSAGRSIHVPHPKSPDQFITVKVPKNAKAGQTMLVPVPPVAKPKPFAEETPSAPTPSVLAEGPGLAAAAPAPASAAAVASAPTPAKPSSKKGGWSTGAKVAAGVAGAGVVVGGVILGAEVAEHGVEATADSIGDAFSAGADAAGDALGHAGDAIGDVAADAGDALGDFAGHAGEEIGDFAAHAGEFFVDAGESAGDFIMDLF